MNTSSCRDRRRTFCEKGPTPRSNCCAKFANLSAGNESCQPPSVVVMEPFRLFLSRGEIVQEPDQLLFGVETGNHGVNEAVFQKKFGGLKVGRQFGVRGV